MSKLTKRIASALCAMALSLSVIPALTTGADAADLQGSSYTCCVGVPSPGESYYLESACGTRMALTVEGSGNGSNVTIRSLDYSPRQRIKLYKVYDGLGRWNGSYSIQFENGNKNLYSTGSGYCKNVNVNGSVSGSKANSNQQWRLESADKNSDKNYYYIKNAWGYCLDVSDGKGEEGKNVWTYGGNGTDAQKWRFIRVGGDNSYSNGYYYIVPTTNQNLALTCASTANGASVKLSKKTNSDYQKVYVESYSRNGNRAYVLKFKASGLALDISGGSDSNGADVIQWSRHNGKNQQWFFEAAGGYVGNDFYRGCFIRSGLGTYLDVDNCKMKSGTNVHSWEGNGTTAQFWTLIKA